MGTRGNINYRLPLESGQVVRLRLSSGLLARAKVDLRVREGCGQPAGQPRLLLAQTQPAGSLVVPHRRRRRRRPRAICRPPQPARAPSLGPLLIARAHGNRLHCCCCVSKTNKPDEAISGRSLARSAKHDCAPIGSLASSAARSSYWLLIEPLA